MIQLRAEGWGYSALGREFGKDHTTIMYHCQRLGLTRHKPAPKEVDDLQFKIEELDTENYNTRPAVTSKYAHLLGEEKINPGKKNYAEYLAEALTRPTEKRYYEIYYGHYDGPKHEHGSGLALITLLEEEARSEDNPTDT